MNTSTNPAIILDCIIFGLQQYGGIANYWARLLDSQPVGNGTAELLLPHTIQFRGFKEEWLRQYRVHRELQSPQISRYRAARCDASGDVFHTSYYRLPDAQHRRYVVTVYDFMYERYRRGPSRWVHTLQKKRSLERADAILCISAFTRDDVLSFFPRVEPSRLHVVPLGIDTEAYYPDWQAADVCLCETALYVGQRRGYKRFDLAVEAVSQARAALRLGIVGPALSVEERAQLDRLLAGRWQYFGAVSASRLRQLYSASYALLFPSDCEGFGLPLLEAMACGCPVVAARRASLPEVGGDAALYADEQSAEEYAAALERLADTGLRAQLIADGALRVSQFTWARTCELTQEMYRAVR